MKLSLASVDDLHAKDVVLNHFCCELFIFN